MSYFPPPPPAPPPAQNFPLPHDPSNPNGFRGRGSRGHRGGGFQARSGNSNRSRGGYSRTVSNTRGYGGHYGHPNGSFDQQNARHSGPSNRFTEANSAKPAYLPFAQPQPPQNLRNSIRTAQAYQQPVHGGFVDQNGEAPQNAGNYGSPASGEYRVNNFQLSASSNSHPGAIIGEPTLRGPTIRIGFNQQHNGIHSELNFQNAQQNSRPGGYRHPYSSNGQNGLPAPHHSPQNTFQNYGGRGRKRGHSEAFVRGGRAQGPPKGQAPPAVPNFGGPLSLPTKPPAPQGEKKLRRKKKRKHNQLGLTPRAEEHESSDEVEEDIGDEETRLAAAATSGGRQSQLLQVNYRGRKSTLQSSSDIAAWIAERKKRFPTKARAAEAAEKKRQREESQKIANLARNERREKHITEAKEKKRRRRQKADEEATNGKRKVEKLRKQLEKEEKRIAKAEARTQKRKRSPSPIDPKEHRPSQNVARIDENSVSVTNFADPLTPTSQPPDPGEADQAIFNALMSDSSSNTSSLGSEDITSSSGLDSSDSDDVPEEATSKREKSDTLPPKRGKPKNLCKYFMANGRCRSGASCKFKHELPERGSKIAKAKEGPSRREGRKERTSLYQRLVEQEKKNEEEAVLKATIHLGDRGILDEHDEDPQI